MSRAPGFRGALCVVLVGLAAQTGCIHNHYYGTAEVMPGCPPSVGSTATTRLGALCDVPSARAVVTNPGPAASVSTSVSAPSKRTPSIGASMDGSSRVVISQPAYGPPSAGQSASRFRWHKPDPENLPTMKVEGGLDDSIFR